MINDFTHISHGISSVIALLTGTYISLSKKGTLLHKKVGYVYVVSMIFTIITSFGIFDLFKGFGIFHVMSLISLVSIIIGMYYPLFNRKNSGWVIQHYFWMLYSFIGLIMALGSHFIKYMPADWDYWQKGVLAWFLPYSIGTFLVYKYKAEVKRNFMSTKSKSS